MEPAFHRSRIGLGPTAPWFRDPDNQVISVFQLTPERG
jgi:hypothetical protein